MPTSLEPNYDPTTPSRRLPLRLISIVGVIILAVAATAFFLFRQNGESSTTTTNQDLINGEIPELPSSFNQIPDQDRDRLTDNQENELGTNPAAADSDEDELNDYDEVGIYKTDPLNPDTDNDGFSDGYEVNQGFNPTGEGELLNINSALETQPE